MQRQHPKSRTSNLILEPIISLLYYEVKVGAVELERGEERRERGGRRKEQKGGERGGEGRRGGDGEE